MYLAVLHDMIGMTWHVHVWGDMNMFGHDMSDMICMMDMTWHNLLGMYLA